MGDDLLEAFVGRCERVGSYQRLARGEQIILNLDVAIEPASLILRNKLLVNLLAHVSHFRAAERRLCSPYELTSRKGRRHVSGQTY